jgi:amidase
VAAGIGPLAHGTDIGGSIRYPAYACGVHGLRPTPGRVPAYNATGPERAIGPQLMAVSGPIARTIADLRLGLAAMAAPDPRDPWWTPAPLDGPPAPHHAAICFRPGGMAIVAEVEAALKDAARRLQDAGWSLDEVDDTPPLIEAAELQQRLWLGDGFAGFADAVAREGDPGALAVMAAVRLTVETLPPDVVARTLVRRATLIREWRVMLARHPVLLLPVSGELPFPDGLDMQGDAGFHRVSKAQLTQTGLPILGLPALSVATGLAGSIPVGVQIVADRFREDLCFKAGEAIEARGVPPSPIDPS